MRLFLSTALAALLGMAGAASAVTVTMDAGGAFGNKGTSTNKLVQTSPLSSLSPSIAKVTISQGDNTQAAFTLNGPQGNDLLVRLDFYDGSDNLVGTLVDAAVNWRTTTGSSVTGFGILPPAGTNTIGGYTLNGPGSNIFLANPANPYTPISSGVAINGNSATVKTLLDDLNALVVPTVPAGEPSMRVQKTVAYNEETKVATYTITVANLSDSVSLADVTVTDTFSADGVPEDLSANLTTPTLTEGTGTGSRANDSTNTIGDSLVYDVLGPLDSITYTATIDLTSYLENGDTLFENLATASAKGFTDIAPLGTVETEELGTLFDVNSSASGNSVPNSNTDDYGAPTVLNLAGAGMTVTKTADTSDLQKPVQPGDVIHYTITVANTGAVDLTDVILTDALTDDEAIVGIDDGVLTVGEVNTYSASYTITDADLAAGKVDNIASVDAVSPIGGLFTVESSADGNTDSTGSPTTVEFGLIDQIRDDLKDILENDLRQTVQMQSARFGRMSKSALETLKAGASDECGTVQPLDANGNASTEDGSLQADVSVKGETVDCVTGERRIVTADLTSSTVEGMGQQIAGAFSIQRERFANADAVRGRFFGGYVTSNDVTGRAEGSIAGLGVNAGIYGANRLSEQTYVDHYLALAFGQHRFDLNFGALDPINAVGDYSYLAGFGGLALSTSTTKGGMEVAPRLALDLAYAVAGDVNVIARQFDRVENGTITLANHEGARVTAEVLFANIDSAAEKSGVRLEATPRVFCDVSLNQVFENACGYGASLSLDADAGAGLSYAALFDYEDSSDRRVMTFSLERSREIAGGSGAVVSTMGMSEEGDLSIGQMLKLRF